jgi:hypothetical protein
MCWGERTITNPHNITELSHVFRELLGQLFLSNFKGCLKLLLFRIMLGAFLVANTLAMGPLELLGQFGAAV